MVESQRRPRARGAPTPAGGLLVEFETVYRANFGVVTAFFARRSTDPQTVADLTSDTFVQAIVSFPTFDPGRGTTRAWLIGIARRVFAKHCESTSRNRDLALRLGGYRELDVDEAAELVARIDAEHEGRGLLDAMTSLSALDREAVELVDLVGMTAGALTVAGSIGVAVTTFGGNTPAFAVSKGADGTVTLSIKDIRAVDAANAELRRIGAPIVAVPMRADCTETVEIDEGFVGESSGSVTSVGVDEGSVTVQTKGLRPDATMLIAAKKDGDVLTLSEGFAVQGKVPSCLPDLPEGSGDSSGGVSTVVPVSPTRPGR